jgi:predicted Zn-dependent peptidase
MFEELAREGPTEGELEKARRRIAWDARSMPDSAEETGAFFASGLLFDRFATPPEHVAELTAVGAQQVREAARELARPERLNVVAVGLLDDGEDVRLGDVVKGWAGAA